MRKAALRASEVGQIVSAFTHPTIESMEALATLGWAASEFAGTNAAKSILIASPFALFDFIGQLCFVTLSQLEKLRGQPFSGDEKKVALTAMLNLANFMGCVTEGAKFATGMYAVLKPSDGQSLSIASKLFIAAIALFRFAKERAVAFEVAQAFLNEMGFNSDTVKRFFKLPILNGKIYIVDLLDLIIKNQPTIEGSLHGLAVYHSLKNVTGLSQFSLMEMIASNPAMSMMIFSVSIFAISAEKTVQRFDAEKAFAQKYQDDVRKLLKQMQLELSRASQQTTIPQPGAANAETALLLPETPEEAAKPKNRCAEAVKNTQRGITAVVNLAGGVVGKFVDVTNLLNPIYWLVQSGYATLMIKLAGNIAFGVVAASSVLDTPGAFRPDPGSDLAPVIRYGFPIFMGVAAIAQRNARVNGANHLLGERYDEPQTTSILHHSILDAMRQALREAFFVASGCSRREMWDSFSRAYVPDSDAIAKDELNAAINIFVTHSNTPSLDKKSVVDIFLDHPELAIQCILMERAVKRMQELQRRPSAENTCGCDMFAKEAGQIKGKALAAQLRTTDVSMQTNR